MQERLRTIIADARASAEGGNHVHAAMRFHEAAQNARRFELSGELAFCLRHAAQSSLENGQIEEALVAAEEAFGIYSEIETPRGMNFANSARLVALAKEALGKHEEARSLWNEARTIYDIHGFRDGVTECDAHLSR